jgi:hypothetical protein
LLSSPHLALVILHDAVAVFSTKLLYKLLDQVSCCACCVLLHRRATYDQTGITDDDLLGGDASELASYFRSVYRKVTEEDIDMFYVSEQL